ncbi:flagellar export protein FliJ [Acetobacter suratthaniensis]|uniref:Flagellar FliJ protein n=1 Tax=Acetobacter suratthaniensis TaxID=1502841 RepID=A0ABS3LJY0_9PROT|nr:flagellar export protein FliJ [Acetobacter suratthaniensis]MBO1327889.1 flagellar export protein FliJ [Acetobacter suratthaniensis]MCX2565931.1 flagellar export protein FliJ [Acetobacter suratthaniensis]
MNPRARALQSLIRLRKTEVDQARAELGRVLAQERAAEMQLAQSRQQLENEQREVTAGRTSMEDFRVWLPAGRAAIERAHRLVFEAQQVTDQARAALTQANAALKAAEAVLARWQEEEREKEARREQNEVDDLSRRVRRVFG